MWRGGFEMKHTRECKEAEEEYKEGRKKYIEDWKKYYKAKKKCGCLK